MKRETFCSIMQALKKSYDSSRELAEDLSKVIADHKETFLSEEGLRTNLIDFTFDDELFLGIVRALEKDFNDIGEWVEYFIYDLEWGTKWTENCVIDKNGSPVKLETIEDLYEILMQNNL